VKGKTNRLERLLRDR